MTLPRWLSEPMVHFLAAGVLIFSVTTALSPHSSEVILVSSALRDGLATDFRASQGRAPTEDELSGLVEGHVADEALYREARGLGLDRSDPIVRRRLVQRMQFVLEDLDPPVPPTAAQLQAWLDAHPEDYLVPERAAVEHVFAAADRHADPVAVASAWLAALRQGESVSGDASAHGRALPLLSEIQLRAKLGAAAARGTFEAEDGVWMGPFASTHGQHILRVAERRPARAGTLETSRAALERDWGAVEAQRRTDAAVQRLVSRYRVETPR